VSIPEAVAVAPGGVLFCWTLTVAVAEHPVAGWVTVSVYMPGTVVVGFCNADVKLPGPTQLYVTPGVVDVPFNVTVVVKHDSEPEAEAAALTTIEFCSTTTAAVDTQPFAGFITVKT
jgi:hypothetical protein